MKLGRRILVLAALATFATFVLGATAPVAGATSAGPIHPTNCTWDLVKTATLHSDPSHTITSLDLALNESVQVDYKVVVSRTGCDPTVDLHNEGGSGQVIDSFAGQLSPDHLFLDVPADHPASATYTYSRTITATSCDSFDVNNSVQVLDGDPTAPFAWDSLTIHVTVHCASHGGCTLTQGYWKTHSILGPAAKPDPTWNLVGGPNAPFFLSGKSWIQVFGTAPAGNGYYILADQYMAAVLNILNGASAPASVTSAIGTAAGLFSTYTPAQIAALKGNDPLRQQFISLGGLLGSYNEGAIGPGHCSE